MGVIAIVSNRSDYLQVPHLSPLVFPEGQSAGPEVTALLTAQHLLLFREGCWLGVLRLMKQLGPVCST